MIAIALLERFAADRTDLPHPLELPARDADGDLIACACGLPLASREYQPDYDHDGERYVWCGNDTCRPCQIDNGPAAAEVMAAQPTRSAAMQRDGAAGPASMVTEP